MESRGLLIAALATAVAACASTVPERSSLQSPVYMVGDSAPTIAVPSPAQGERPSVVRRVYWFFAGR